MRKIISFLVIGIFILSAFGVIGTSSEDPDFEKKEIDLEISNPQIIDNVGFSEVFIEDSNGYTMEPGKPMLPVYRKTFNFPVGTDIKDLNVKIENKKTIELDKEIKIAPQPIKIKSLNSESYQAQKAIKLKNVYPEEDYYYKIGRGISEGKPTLFLTIQVNPCSYNPLDETITVAKNIKIFVSTNKEIKQEKSDELYNFVIISPSYFYGELEPIVTHKTNKGITTKLVTLDDISNGRYFTKEGRDEIEEIKYFIKNAYDNWYTRNVLIVGG